MSSNSKEWFQHHDIANKLKQALENVIVGQGLHIVFDGLQDGEALITVSYNGETCTFYSKTPPSKAEKTCIIEPDASATDPADLTSEDPAIILKPKRSRKPKVEATEAGADIKAEW